MLTSARACGRLFSRAAAARRAAVVSSARAGAASARAARAAPIAYGAGRTEPGAPLKATAPSAGARACRPGGAARAGAGGRAAAGRGWRRAGAGGRPRAGPRARAASRRARTARASRPWCLPGCSTGALVLAAGATSGARALASSAARCCAVRQLRIEVQRELRPGASPRAGRSRTCGRARRRRAARRPRAAGRRSRRCRGQRASAPSVTSLKLWPGGASHARRRMQSRASSIAASMESLGEAALPRAPSFLPPRTTTGATTSAHGDDGREPRHARAARARGAVERRLGPLHGRERGAAGVPSVERRGARPAASWRGRRRGRASPGSASERARGRRERAPARGVAEARGAEESRRGSGGGSVVSRSLIRAEGSVRGRGRRGPQGRLLRDAPGLLGGARGDAADLGGELGRELVRARPLLGRELHRADAARREQRRLGRDLLRIEPARARGRDQVPRRGAARSARARPASSTRFAMIVAASGAGT